MAQIADFDRLMTEVAAGSEDAIWQLAETYTPYIIRAVRSKLSPGVRQKLDSQDFAQTLWASILLNDVDLTRLKNPQELIAYLAEAAKNKVIDATRRYTMTQKYNIFREERLSKIVTIDRSAQRSAPAALHSRDPTPSQFASLRERWSRVLESATERDREILRLRLRGRTFKQVAAQLQIDQVTARRTIQSLIGQLSK